MLNTLLQNKPATLYLFIRDASDVPLTGLTSASLLASTKKYGKAGAAKTVTASNFREVSATDFPGVYEFDLTVGDTDTLGTLLVSIREAAASGVATQTLEYRVEAAGVVEDAALSAAEDVYIGPVAQYASHTFQAYFTNGQGVPVPGIVASDLEFNLIRSGVSVGSTITWGGQVSPTLAGVHTLTLPDTYTMTAGELDLYVKARPNWGASAPLLESATGVFYDIETYVGAETYGLVVGAVTDDGGAVFETTDNVVWTRVTAVQTLAAIPPATTFTFRACDVALVAGNMVRVVVDENGHFYVNKDDGGGWVLYNTVTYTGVEAVAIHTADSIWAVTGDGKILKFNGTVTSLHADNGPKAYRDCNVYGTELWVVGLNGVVDAVTGLGGVEGSADYSTRLNLLNGADLHAISKPNASDDVLIVGEGVWATTDAMTTFSPLHLPTVVEAVGGKAVDGNSLVFKSAAPDSTGYFNVTDGTTWLRTHTDGGGDWAAQTTPYTAFDVGRPRISQTGIATGSGSSVWTWATSLEVAPKLFRFSIGGNVDLTDLEAGVNTVKDRLAQDTFYGVLPEGVASTATVVVRNEDGYVTGKTIDTVKANFWKDGVYAEQLLDFTEVNSGSVPGAYTFTVPLLATTGTGEIYARLEPRYLVNLTSSLIAAGDGLSSFQSVDTLDDELGKYGLLVGEGAYIYKSTDLIYWSSDTTLAAFLPYAGIKLQKCRVKRVGTNIVRVIVADDGYIFVDKGAGAGWTVTSPGSWEGLRDIAIYDADNIWAIGDGSLTGDRGRIAHFNGTVWTQFAINSSKRYSACQIYGDQLYVVGYSPSGLFDIVTDITGTPTLINGSSRVSPPGVYYDITEIAAGGRILLSGIGAWQSVDGGLTFSRLNLPFVSQAIFPGSVDGDAVPFTVAAYDAYDPENPFFMMTGTSERHVFLREVPGSLGTQWQQQYTLADWRGYVWPLDMSNHRIATGYVWISNIIYDIDDNVTSADSYGLATLEWSEDKGFQTVHMRWVVTASADVAGIEATLASMQGVGFDTNTDSLVAIAGAGGVDLSPVLSAISAVQGDVDALTASMVRVLGLSQENLRITGQEYDVNNNLIGSTITLYPSAADVLTQTGALAVYEMVASYDVNNRLVDYRFARTT